uniref:DUF148 domain-containing protein n=1 Tax=Rhabditophanes sp. KR3021 TaxID=114890 RepID=A0AC35U498_9BILA
MKNQAILFLLSTFFLNVIAYPKVSPEEDANWRIIDAFSETTKQAAQGLSENASQAFGNVRDTLGNWFLGAKESVNNKLDDLTNNFDSARQGVFEKFNEFSNTAGDTLGQTKNHLEKVVETAEGYVNEVKRSVGANVLKDLSEETLF